MKRFQLLALLIIIGFHSFAQFEGVWGKSKTSTFDSTLIIDNSRKDNAPPVVYMVSCKNIELYFSSKQISGTLNLYFIGAYLERSLNQYSRLLPKVNSLYAKAVIDSKHMLRVTYLDTRFILAIDKLLKKYSKPSPFAYQFYFISEHLQYQN